MKILVICQYYYPEQFRINDICETLVKQKNEVTVLTGLPNYPTGKVPKEYKFFRKRKEIINGVNVIRTFEIGRRKGFLFRILNYISFAISASMKVLFIKNDYDIIYVYQLSPVLMAIPGIIYKKKNHKNLILYCLDLWPDSMKSFGIKDNSKIYRLIDKISKEIYRYADKILISSKMFHTEIQNSKDIVYLPQYAEEFFCKKTLKEHKECNFVFAGNVGKAQSVETIIKAAEILRNEKNIRIHIVGDGSALKENQELANKLQLKNVIFYGRKNIKEMQEYYDLADAMLVTLGKDEFASKTLPGKVQACMATANPIIASADGETQNVIEEAMCGFCVPAEDYKGLAKKIKEFSILNNLEKEKMGKNAFEFYKNNFKKDIFFRKLIKIFKEEKNGKI